MSLIQIAFIMFAAIASGGLLMVGLIVTKNDVPSFLGPVHGLGGFASLCVLLAANLQNHATPARAWWALAVFAAGLLGGVTLFRVLFKKSAPLFLILGHGSVAVVGLYLLYGVAF